MPSNLFGTHDFLVCVLRSTPKHTPINPSLQQFLDDSFRLTSVSILSWVMMGRLMTAAAEDLGKSNVDSETVTAVSAFLCCQCMAAILDTWSRSCVKFLSDCHIYQGWVYLSLEFSQYTHFTSFDLLMKVWQRLTPGIMDFLDSPHTIPAIAPRPLLIHNG